MRNWNLGDFRVRVNLPSQMRHVRVLIQRVIAPIRGLLNPLRQVVLLISRIRSYPPYCSHLHPPSLSILSTTLPSSQAHKDKSYDSICPCHEQELILSAAYTEVCQSFLHSQNYELTPGCSPGIWRTSRRIDHHQPVLYMNVKGKVTSSHSDGFESTNRSIESLHPARLPLIASKSTTSKSTPPISLDNSRQVHLQTSSISAFKWISKLTRTRSRRV